MTPDRIDSNKGWIKTAIVAVRLSLVAATGAGVAGSYKGAESWLNSRSPVSATMANNPDTGLLVFDPTATATIANRTTGEMSAQQINALPGDPAVNAEHFIATCLQPDYRVSVDKSSLERMLSLFSPSVAEAAPESSKTPAEVVDCLKKQPLLRDFVLKNKGVDLSKIQESDVKGGEVIYAELPQTLVNLKLTTLEQAKAIFGSKVLMTFQVDGVISSGPASMLNDEAEVARRRGNGEKMLFSTKEFYRIVNINGITLVFRQDCANLLLTESPKATATATLTSTPAPAPSETAINTPIPTATATPNETPTPAATATATRPATPTPAPTSTPRPTIVPQPPLPTATIGVGPTETPQPIATRVPTNTPITPEATSTVAAATSTPRPTIAP